MTKAKHKNEAPPVLKIQGSLTIYEVADLRHRLLDHLKNNDELWLELAEVTDCDTAGIQLLYSAFKTARDQSKFFDLKTVSLPVKEAAERAGINVERLHKAQEKA